MTDFKIVTQDEVMDAIIESAKHTNGDVIPVCSHYKIPFKMMFGDSTETYKGRNIMWV